jgi:hypothetical protein
MEPDIAQEWLDAGWDDLDPFYAIEVLDDALDYMDEAGYI